MAVQRIYMSERTMRMLFSMQRDAMECYSEKYNISSALVKAICKKESSNNHLAIRIEPHLKKASWYRRALTGVVAVEDYHYCSFGLMQIMYGTARHQGYLGKPFNLLNPDLAVKHGCKHLAWCIKRYKGNIWDAVAAYNQGNNRYYDINKNGIKDVGEKYYNQPYVDKVKELYQSFGGRV